ncbi:hypothetical protein DVH24_021931 [Malus domestica]|uniref:Uncharacterized protein n=1 Tax=Malus domestica TaxID=3750 RepID=A0A498ITA8_MALDO|nr:hypothetical protein DVH24_021931 [Malus domestica]
MHIRLTGSTPQGNVGCYNNLKDNWCSKFRRSPTQSGVQYLLMKTNEKGLKTFNFNDKDKIKDKVNSIKFDILV